MKKILFIFLIFSLAGCYNYKELNEFAYTSSIGISKLDNKYTISIQTINVQKTEDKNIEFIIYKGIGNTINEAYNDLSKTISKDIYLNSCEVLVINKEININDILTLFTNNKSNKLMYLVINNDINNLFNITSKIDTINSNKIKEILKINNRIITFEEVLDNYLNNKTYSIPSIYLDNNNIKIGSSYLFKKNTLIKEKNNG